MPEKGTKKTTTKSTKTTKKTITKAGEPKPGALTDKPKITINVGKIKWGPLWFGVDPPNHVYQLWHREAVRELRKHFDTSNEELSTILTNSDALGGKVSVEKFIKPGATHDFGLAARLCQLYSKVQRTTAGKRLLTKFYFKRGTPHWFDKKKEAERILACGTKKEKKKLATEGIEGIDASRIRCSKANRNAISF